DRAGDRVDDCLGDIAGAFDGAHDSIADGVDDAVAMIVHVRAPWEMVADVVRAIRPRARSPRHGCTAPLRTSVGCAGQEWCHRDAVGSGCSRSLSGTTGCPRDDKRLGIVDPRHPYKACAIYNLRGGPTSLPMPRVSVVVSHYDRQSLLLQALASIGSQTFRDFEVIVVNDHGADSRSLVEEFAAHSAAGPSPIRVRYDYRPANGG